MNVSLNHFYNCDCMELMKELPDNYIDLAIVDPPQKPVKLYEWILNRYAKQGNIILDTHCGSASSLVACHRMGFNYIGCELDEDYYKLANERLEAEKAQMKLF